MYAKTVDLYNFDDTVIPEVMVIYGASSDEAIYEYAMVDKIVDELNENGDVEKYIKLVSGVGKYQSIPIEKPDNFSGLKP